MQGLRLRFVSIIFILFISAFSIRGQTNDCKILKKASIAFCKEDYELALKSLFEFRNKYPKHALVEETIQQIGHLCFLVNKLDSSIAFSLSIVNGKEYGEDKSFDPLSCATTYDSGSFQCMRIIFPEEYNNLQHDACIDLYNCYSKKGDFNNALKYLTLASHKYYYNYYCGNGDMMEEINMALRFSELYRKMNKPDEALKSLLTYCFPNYLSDNSMVIKEALELIKREFQIDTVRMKIKRGVNNLYLEERENRKYFYITYSGTPINIEYPFYDEKSYSVEDVKSILKKSYFYSQLMNL